MDSGLCVGDGGRGREGASDRKSRRMDLMATWGATEMVQQAFGIDLILECSGSDYFLAASLS